MESISHRWKRSPAFRMTIIEEGMRLDALEAAKKEAAKAVIAGNTATIVQETAEQVKSLEAGPEEAVKEQAT